MNDLWHRLHLLRGIQSMLFSWRGVSSPAMLWRSPGLASFATAWYDVAGGRFGKDLCLAMCLQRELICLGSSTHSCAHFSLAQWGEHVFNRCPQALPLSPCGLSFVPFMWLLALSWQILPRTALCILVVTDLASEALHCWSMQRSTAPRRRKRIKRHACYLLE